MNTSPPVFVAQMQALRDGGCTPVTAAALVLLHHVHDRTT
ncbi:hypothetical protein Gobs_2628 [Geodermatophilus obscurus DSM 43160]|jgi:hypothetical protein|uniref:Uncharacterized protein n=1 Tax=Geodermatophilus obscurus (strain ATCC 25078 / DSM 43160 / JCM 3152 / CCUG 61914 / KCC A-0152 / KCTC 9177 / NBRC 13315 / NRRL B-3577 / G-20) TaxID=526225 RepID=D2S5I5_GEOOG|nr:hypothetical protein Gobs_2628 [Geodermatophilus obscurus DSM 43160]